MKKRLDMMLVERALAPSREKAKAYIMAGQVYVDGQKEDKAGSMFTGICFYSYFFKEIRISSSQRVG